MPQHLDTDLEDLADASSFYSESVSDDESSKGDISSACSSLSGGGARPRSVDNDSSAFGGLEQHDEGKEIRRLAKSETIAVHVWRALVLVLVSDHRARRTGRRSKSL